MQGRVFKNRYRLTEELGRGGMGSVWRAEDLNLHIDVAVKLIDPNYAESADARARFEREALAAAQLRSERIVLITEHGVDDNTPYIVMELLRGKSLAARLQSQGKLSFEETLRVLSQVAEALAFAHDRKIVHRDLKPDNVFIVSERAKEMVKVLDFGVAKKLDAASFGNKLKTHTGMLLGTPYYMSPEQARASAELDHRTDIWSFGVMAYECVIGRRPFDADTLPDLLMSICRDPVVPPSHVAMVPKGFDAWFARAAARELDKRFGNIEDAMDALRVLAGATMVGVAPAVVAVTTGVPVATQVVAPSPAASNSFVPSSVTSPGLHRKPTRKLTAGLSSSLVAGVALAYWLWPSSRGETVNADPATSAPNAAVPDATVPGATVLAMPAATPAPAASATPPSNAATESTALRAAASTASLPLVVPVTPAPESSNRVTPKPKTTNPNPRPKPDNRSPARFSGGF